MKIYVLCSTSWLWRCFSSHPRTMPPTTNEDKQAGGVHMHARLEVNRPMDERSAVCGAKLASNG